MDIVTGLMILLSVLAVLLIISSAVAILQTKNLTQTKQQLAHELAQQQTRTKQSLNTARSVIKGQMAEQLFPLIVDMPFNRSDMHFLGQPVDYIVFDGHSEGEVGTVYFVEIKTGKSALSSIQRSIRDAVEQKRVVWKTVRLLQETAND
jgi:predicted Holliday junction resolvase-like endonuclease